MLWQAAHTGDVFAALVLLEEMRKSGVKPTAKTFTAAMEVSNMPYTLCVSNCFCQSEVVKFKTPVVRMRSQ